MNRLAKKCVVASTGLHLLLVVILFVGPAFLVSQNKPDNLPVLTFIPLKTVDDLVSGGGNPNARPPAPVVQPPPPQPQAQPPAPAPEPPQPARIAEPVRAREPEPARTEQTESL